jgi:hypothetical protein
MSIPRDLRHALYSGLNKARLLFGADYRNVLLAGASGLPILAFSSSRSAMIAAFAFPLVLFIVAGAAYRKDPQFLAVIRLSTVLRSKYDASQRAPRRP